MAKTRGQRIRRGDSIQLQAYAGVDPATGKRKRLTETVPAGLGARELDRRHRALLERADALADEYRRIRSGELSPRQVAEHRLEQEAERTFGFAAEAWWTEQAEHFEPGGRDTPRFVLDAWLLPKLADIELWRLRATLTAAEASACPELVSLRAVYRQLEESGQKNGKPLAAASMQRVHGVARQVLGYATQRGWAATNVARGTRPSPYRRKRRPLPDDRAMAAFLAYLAEKHPAVHLAALLVASGPRPNEVLALRLDSIDFETRIMHLAADWDTAKRRDRSIRLSASVIEAVGRQLVRVGEYATAGEATPLPNGYLFSPDADASSPHDPGWAGQAFSRWVVRARRDGAADVPASMVLYDMRHYGITRQLAARHPVADVAQRFGTSARMIYLAYAHAIPGHDDEMADTLEEIFRSATG